MIDLDAHQIFSLTLWRSEQGFTACIQAFAGECPRQATRPTASEAIAALLLPPCPVEMPGGPSA